MSNWLDTLISRGLIQDVSNRERVLGLKPGNKFYVGFDPTAPSLQLGNLIPLLMCIRLNHDAGLSPIILFGGATGAIGDPSGKNQERQLLEREVIDSNIKNQTLQVEEIMTRAGVKPVFVNNFEWFKDLRFLDFLREVGKHLTINYMLQKEVIKNRIEGDGISYTEFSYMLLQSYDFLYLMNHHNCRLQIGGSEQWGNITTGLELIRRKTSEEVSALSMPLLLDSEGRKFGKSEGNALWLDAHETSPYKLHQFFLNTDDKSVENYLKVFTFLSDDQITNLMASFKNNPEKREAQRRLADDVVTLVHGEDATKDSNKAAEVLFGGSFEGLSKNTLLDIFSDVPSSQMTKCQLKECTVVDLFVNSGLCPSKNEAKRLIQAGGAYINNERVQDLNQKLEIISSPIVLRSGKKKYHLLKIE